jgi:hypothetical protein
MEVRMRTSIAVLVLSSLFLACEPSGGALAPPEPVAHHTVPDHLNALVERAWGGNVIWEMVKPRPPGVPARAHTVVWLYQIAPVDSDDPLSPPFTTPDVDLGGRDHVVDVPGAVRPGSPALARTVPVLLPGWEPEFPPFPPIGCEAPDLGPLAGRIAWRWVDPVPHPCGRAPAVYAAELVEGSGCLVPLTSVDRVLQAVELGLARLEFPPEPAWPFAIRPLTAAGTGRVVQAAPACVTP